MLEPGPEARREIDEPFIAARLGGIDPSLPEYARERARILEQLTEQRRRVVTWEVELAAHSEHPTFRCYASAVLREFGFWCGCEAMYDRSIGLGSLRHSSKIRELIELTQRIAPPPAVAIRERALLPNRRRFPPSVRARARAMLHQLLTREQRWSLRASGSFRVLGQDGRTYEVTEGQAVKLIENGEATFSYCIHPMVNLPPHDVMIGQKLLLETSIEHFLATANRRDLRSFATRLDEALDVAMAEAPA